MQNNQIFNTLIVSPPGKGKTTILKDIIIKFNNLNCGQILVIDERNEFSLVSGENVDRVVYSNKDYAFNFAIRSMSPEIVVTDELASNEDWGFVNNAVNSGIKVIASCHAGTKNELQEKECFINNLFERYVFLKNTNIPGVLDHIFDSNFIEL